jgi:arylformamidase
MTIQITLPTGTYTLSPTPIDLSIPLQFNGPQPNSYGVPPAVSQAFEGGGFIGDVRRGGSCNFETYHLTPHCNGTHTECVGHITAERLAVHELLQDDFLPATLLSVAPQEVPQSADSYDPPLKPGDKIITRQQLASALENISAPFLKALIIRTLPHDEGKLRRDYMQEAPAFFSLEAMRYIRERGVEHLLVDLPSVDRLFDEGKLSNHRIFWDVVGVAGPSSPTSRTITEFIFVPEEVMDGHYLLNLQIAPFVSDAAPSRPRIFRLAEQ